MREQETTAVRVPVIRWMRRPRQWRRPPWLRSARLRFTLDLLGPTALLYLLLWRGVSLYLALLASALISAISALIAYRRRTGDGQFALIMLALPLAGLGVALITGSNRFLLAKESLLTAIVGAWFIGSLRAARPLTYRFTRPLLERRIPRKTRSWEALWAEEPRFRRIWYISTIMWGVATLLDAVLRVVIAYTLPVAAVPALQTGLLIVTTLIMQVVTNTYYISAGLWRMLHEEPTD